jgi:hypothetical protein
VFRAHALDKPEMLARLLQAHGRGLSMVFVRTKRTAAKLADDLSDRGFAAASVHGDLGQGQREQALRAFRSGKVDVLVATDVAARGIAVTFVDWDDLHRWSLINTALELPFPDPPETYSTSEHLYEALEIPSGATGLLPRGKRTRAGLAAEELEDLGETGGRGRNRSPRGAKQTAPKAEAPDARSPATPGRRRRRRRTRAGGPNGSSAAAG